MFFYVLFRDSHFREHLSVAVFIMRGTIQRSPKKAVVEIFINSEENVWVACKFW